MAARAATDQAAAERQARRVGTLRLVGVAISALLAVGSRHPVGSLLWGVLLLACLLGGGAILGRWQDAVRAHARRRRYHEHGLERAAQRWQHGQPGASAQPSLPHAYAVDVDLVGAHGLFALLDTAASAGGRRLLAAWLFDSEAPIDTGRAHLVRSLSRCHAWRAELACSARQPGEAAAAGYDLPSLDPGPLPEAVVHLLRILLVGSVVALVAVLGLEGAWPLVLAVLALAAGIDAWATRSLSVLGERSGLAARLADEASALERIAALAAQPDLPDELAEAARAARDWAAGARRGEAIADQLSAHANPVWAYGPGALLLAEWHGRARLIRWQRTWGASRDAWLACIARLDALSCLATYAAEQGGCWPVWSATGPFLALEQVAHPLLPRPQRVANDLVLELGETLIITGSNASGKSTFLRTVAVASVLARLGTTVCAQRCQLRALRLATVMHARDDLQAGVSRFQAEVQALRRCLDVVARAGDPVLVALDEILGGTNSRERRIGTAAMLAALAQRAGAVLISTHDLSLADLAASDPARIRLAHFTDLVVVDGASGAAGADATMRFEYRLCPGLLATTNALRVMRAAGLPVALDPP